MQNHGTIQINTRQYIMREESEENISLDKILSIRPNGQIFALYKKIQEHQEWGNRNEITKEAIKYAFGSKNDWKAIAKYKIVSETNDDSIPNFIQIRVDEEQYIAVREQIFNAFPCNKNVPPAPYVIKLVLINYLLYLETLEELEDEHVQASALLMNGDICTKGEASLAYLSDACEKFKILSADEKLNAIYRKLLEIESMKIG